jgi:fumarate reductase iron-sulfur subunit
MSDDRTITLEVFRYQPPADGGETAAEPRFQSYQVPYHDDWVVLDALNWIKDQLDGSLAYRWSCRMGVCGSCGMMINGEPGLACAIYLKQYLSAPGKIRVEPLTNFPVNRDLVIDLEGFLDKLDRVRPYIDREDINDVSQGEYLQTPAELAAYKQYSMCINCMLCYAACPVVGMEPEFLGPAALALGQRYNMDSRDRDTGRRLDAMMEHKAIWDCTFVGECSVVCPKSVDPAGAIQQAKVQAAKHWYQRWLMPLGTRT